MRLFTLMLVLGCGLLEKPTTDEKKQKPEIKNLAFVSSPSTVNDILCYRIVLAAVNSEGKPANPSEDLNISLESSTGEFFRDPLCTTATDLTRIPTFSNNKVIYWKGNITGIVKLKAFDIKNKEINPANYEMTLTKSISGKWQTSCRVRQGRHVNDVFEFFEDNFRWILNIYKTKTEKPCTEKQEILVLHGKYSLGDKIADSQFKSIDYIIERFEVTNHEPDNWNKSKVWGIDSWQAGETTEITGISGPIIFSKGEAILDVYNTIDPNKYIGGLYWGERRSRPNPSKGDSVKIYHKITG